MERSNVVSTIIGGRNSGKTTFAKEVMKFYPPRDMKVLIVDTFDHPSYRDIPIITSGKLGAWKKGVYRMFGSDFDTMFSSINDNLWNSLIIFEDAYKYQEEKLDRNVKQFVIDSKQKNLDIMFMYHAWGWVPKDLFRISDVLEVFKCEDSPEDRKNNMRGCYDRTLNAYNEVKDDKFPYAHKSVQVRS